MSKEAMKLALEALKQIDEAMPFPVAKLAQAALREALAEQPAQQEPVALKPCWYESKEKTMCRKCGQIHSEAISPAEQPQQEPVAPTAVEMQNAAANLALMREMWGNAEEPAAKVNDDGFIVETGLLLSPGTQLYTSPPAQRTWVGLTDVEWMNIVNKDHAWFGQRPEDVAHEVAKLVETKLKEKNT